MRIGVVFPQFEFAPDPAAIRAYAEAAEQLGYAHIGADDHVIGPNPDRPGGWRGWVTYQTPFFEPLTLFSFMAGVTRRVEFSTCVLLLPQRQTVLVAKQAATLDALSGGRLRLGIGLGWNQIEYESLGEDFHSRGRRVEEQIDLLRQLWTQELVAYSGRWHTVPDAGIKPRPIQRPIPIWFGGHAEAVLRRMARLGDGWMPLYASPVEAQPVLDRLAGYLAEAGRERAGFGLEARLPYERGDEGEWLRQLEGWQAAGFTHLSLITTRCGFTTPALHLAALERFARAMGLE